MEEAFALLEKTVAKLDNYLDNLKSERDFFVQEAQKQEDMLSTALKFRKITLEKLEFLKKTLADEIKIDLLSNTKKDQEIKTGPIHILMMDDEGSNSHG